VVTNQAVLSPLQSNVISGLHKHQPPPFVSLKRLAGRHANRVARRSFLRPPE